VGSSPLPSALVLVGNQEQNTTGLTAKGEETMRKLPKAKGKAKAKGKPAPIKDQPAPIESAKVAAINEVTKEAFALAKSACTDSQSVATKLSILNENLVAIAPTESQEQNYNQSQLCHTLTKAIWEEAALVITSRNALFVARANLNRLKTTPNPDLEIAITSTIVACDVALASALEATTNTNELAKITAPFVAAMVQSITKEYKTAFEGKITKKIINKANRIATHHDNTSRRLPTEAKLNPDHSRYTKYPDQKTTSGKAKYDINDDVATSLRDKTHDEIIAFAVDYVNADPKTKIPVTLSSLTERWAHLNPGMQRMNAGNVIRGSIRRQGIAKVRKAAAEAKAAIKAEAKAEADKIKAAEKAEKKAVAKAAAEKKAKAALAAKAAKEAKASKNK